MFLKQIIANVRKILGFSSAKHRKQLKILILLSLFMGVIELGVAGMVSLLGVTLAAPETILNLSLMKRFLAEYPSLIPYVEQPAIMLALILSAVVSGLIVKNVFLGFITYKQSYFNYSISARLGASLIQSFLSKPYNWHLNKNPAESHTIFSFRNQIVQYIIHCFNLFTQGVIFLFLFIGGLVLAPVSSITVFSLTGLSAFVIYRTCRHSILNHSKEVAAIDLQVNKQVLAALNGIREVQIYRRQRFFVTKIADNLNEVSRRQAISLTLQPLPMWVLEVVGIATLLLSLVIMINLDYPMTYITGSLTLLAAMAWRLLPCMNKSVAAVMGIQAFTHYVDKFFTDLQLVELGTENNADIKKLTFNDSFSFNNVSFKYNNTDQRILHDIQLTVKKGQSVGIIGRSGAGKSTLIGLMTGLFTPSQGTISLDGVTCDDSNKAGLSSIIGYVPQAPYLLDASLGENIAFSRWGEQIDEEKIKVCCQMAAIDFIEQLPEGLNTNIGERGVRLSGGQIQRIAIARALYADPELILFDEATSALDGASEHAIQQTIDKLQATMTLVIVAHRLTTVEGCDVIYWLDQGKVVTSGDAATVLKIYKESIASKSDES